MAISDAKDWLSSQSSFKVNDINWGSGKVDTINSENYIIKAQLKDNPKQNIIISYNSILGYKMISYEFKSISSFIKNTGSLTVKNLKNEIISEIDVKKGKIINRKYKSLPSIKISDPILLEEIVITSTPIYNSFIWINLGWLLNKTELPFTNIYIPYDESLAYQFEDTAYPSSYNGTGGYIYAPEFQGQSDEAVDAKKMMDCFKNIPSAGATYSATVYVQEPLPGTTSNISTNWVGHVAIGLTKTGNDGKSTTQVIGFYPSGLFGGQGEIHNNGGLMDYNVSISYSNISETSFENMMFYISLPPPYYDLVSFNCASYVYNATIVGGLSLPSPYSITNITNISPLQACPANLGANIRANSSGNSNINSNGGFTPISKGECN